MSTELAVREWVRSLPAITALLVTPDRVDFGYPGDSPGTRVRLFRAGGEPEAIVNIDRALMTFQCFGTSRGAADRLATTLVWELRRLHADAVHPLRAGQPSGPTWSPDEAGHAMYSVTALVTARLTAPAV
jgi:hypothetical protein